MPNNTLILGNFAASGSLYTQNSLLFGKFSDATDFEVNSFINNTSGSLSFDFTNDRFSFNKPVSASVFYGDGSNLTGVSSNPFPHTGSLITSGGMVTLNTADYTLKDAGQVGGYRIKTREGIYVGVNGDTANAFGMHYAHNMIKYNNGYGRPSLTFGNSDLTFSHEVNAPTLHASSTVKVGGGLGNKIGTTGGNDLDLTISGWVDSSDTSNGYSYIQLYGGNHNPNKGKLLLAAGNNTTYSNIEFYTTGSERMRIANDGNVGIGITDPQALLHVNGEVSASTYYGDGSNLTGISSDPFPYTGSAIISGSLNTKGGVTITGSNALAGNYALKVTNTSGDNILNVENDGNVGLGLADPSYKLQVRGATNNSTDYPFRVENSSGTPLFRVRSDGYVMFGNLGEDLAIDFTGGNRYLKFFNSSISAQGNTGITATGTIGFDPGTGTSNKITFINAADAYGSVHLAQGTAANTTFPNNRGTEILFNREVNHQKHYGIIRGDDNQYQPVPIYIFSGQHTSTSVNQPLILQNLPGGASRGNVGIGLEDPQTSLHVSGSISGSELIGTINGGTF